MKKTEIILRVRGLTKRFGGITAVDNVSFDLERGSRIGLIGPNGAGKTTLFNLITGLIKSDSGECFLRDFNLKGKLPFEIARLGIGRTFQSQRIFRKMSVFDNVILPSVWRRNLDSPIKRANEWIKFFELDKTRNNLGENISGGQMRLMALARVSMMEPEIYLLDEPFFGIHPKTKSKCLRLLLKLNKERNKTLFVISHDITSLMNLSEKIIVMNEGRIIAEGIPEEIRNNEKVIEAYLGR